VPQQGFSVASRSTSARIIGRDPRKPILIIGYSTEAQVRLAISSGRPSGPETTVR
jgi:hypothetical protein